MVLVVVPEHAVAAHRVHVGGVLAEPGPQHVDVGAVAVVVDRVRLGLAHHVAGLDVAGLGQAELLELSEIYRKRGLDESLARQVAEQLSAGESSLDVHLRDELGLHPDKMARPLQAAAVSGASFAVLALVPILALVLAPPSLRIAAIAGVSLVGLGVLGAAGGRLGGAPMGRAALRVLIGGGAAMAATAIIGHLLGAVGIG